MWFQWYLSLLPLLWFGLPYSHWIKVQNCNGISRQIGPSSIVKSVVIYEANFKPNSFLLVNVTEPCEPTVKSVWATLSLWRFSFFVLRTAYDNGKSQFRCEVDMCMCTSSTQHAACSQLPNRFDSQSSARLIQSLNSALTSACCFPKSSQSSQISHFIPEEALTREREPLTVARESSRHSVLMGQDQRLIRFVQTSSACFSQRGEIWGQSQSCCLKWNWDVVCWSFYNLKANCVVRLLLLLSLMRIHVDICCVTSQRLCHI